MTANVVRKRDVKTEDKQGWKITAVAIACYKL